MGNIANCFRFSGPLKMLDGACQACKRWDDSFKFMSLVNPFIWISKLDKSTELDVLISVHKKPKNIVVAVTQHYSTSVCQRCCVIIDCRVVRHQRDISCMCGTSLSREQLHKLFPWWLTATVESWLLKQ